jgi:hypothetical protein
MTRTLRWTLGALAAAAAVYGAAALWAAVFPAIRTETVTAYADGRVITTTGWLLREEQVLTDDHPLVRALPDSGQRVARGETVALAFSDRAAYLEALALERQGRRQDLLAASDGDDPAQLARALAQAVADGDLIAADAAAAALTGRADWTDLAAKTAAVALAAPAAGYFAPAADGLEDVLTPQAADTLTAADLTSLDGGTTPDGAYGRLITGQTWYLAANVGVGRLTVGETVTALLDEAVSVDMTVVRLGDDGLAVLESDRQVAEVAALRQVSTRLTYDRCEGLLVPAEALRRDEDGQPGVYILEAGCARWKSITILRQTGDALVAALDTSDTACLWPGDEVLLTDQELYDGKVVG